MSYKAYLFAGIAGMLTLNFIVSNTPLGALIITNILLGLIVGQLTSKKSKQ